MKHLLVQTAKYVPAAQFSFTVWGQERHPSQTTAIEFGLCADFSWPLLLHVTCCLMLWILVLSLGCNAFDLGWSRRWSAISGVLRERTHATCISCGSRIVQLTALLVVTW